jgi:acetyl-CoA C-acetyltransferase
MMDISQLKDSEIVIVSYARTPIGTLGGKLASFSATQLGAHSVKHALNKLQPFFAQTGKKVETEIDECILGNVMSGNLGQAPARQAAIQAGLPPTVRCTTVNKVCSSGLKSVMYAAQQLALGACNRLVVAGGFESMSNVPYYLPDMRFGKRMQVYTLRIATY